MPALQHRGGVAASNLPAETSYASAPPKSTYTGPTIGGSKGGFISVVTIGGIIVILIAVGVFIFLRRHRARALVESAISKSKTALARGSLGSTAKGGSGASGNGHANDRRGAWREVNDDDYGDDNDPFELPQTLAFDPSQLDLKNGTTTDLHHDPSAVKGSIRDPFSDDKTPYYNPSAVSFGEYDNARDRHDGQHEENPFADAQSPSRRDQS